MYQIVFLTIVQIVLESIPVSSSGHIELISLLLSKPAGVHYFLTQTNEYLLHGPTVCVVAVLFFNTWWGLLIHAWRWKKIIFHACVYTAIADIITAGMYFVLHIHAKDLFPLWLGFSITGFLLFFTKFAKRKNIVAPWRYQAIALGFLQGCASLPGISRLGITYCGGLLLGLSPRKSFAVSCMIQWPLILAGFGLGLFQASTDPHVVPLFFSVRLFVPMVVATVVAYCALRAMQQCAIQETWWKIGFYMIIPISISIACL